LILILAFAGVFGTHPNYATGMDVPICEVVKAPNKFSGQFVRVTGRVLFGPEGSSISAECEIQEQVISLEYPNAEWQTPVPFEIQKDDMFATFEMIADKFGFGMASATKGATTPQPLRKVYATFIGRFDGPDRLTVKDASGNILTRKGFNFRLDSSFVPWRVLQFLGDAGFG
jgi:hypothetical protein